MSVTREDVKYAALDTIEAVINSCTLSVNDKLKIIQTLVTVALKETEE